MTQVVSINGSTRSGKILLSLLKEFKDSKSVTFPSDAELEEKEDEFLLKTMEKGRKNGKANYKRALKKTWH